MRRQAASCAPFHLSGGGCACVNQPRVCWKTRLANLRRYGSRFPFSLRRASEKKKQTLSTRPRDGSDEPTASRRKCQPLAGSPARASDTPSPWRAVTTRPPQPSRALTTDPDKPTSDCLRGRAFACNETPTRICSCFPFLPDFPSAVHRYRDLLAVKTAGGEDSSSSQL